MQMIVSQAILVVLAGIYAMRASSALFKGSFSPLSLLAGFIFIFSVVLFHKPPSSPGIWLYFVMVMCFAGALFNAKLLFYPDALHSDFTAMAFSATSMIGWGILLGQMMLLILADRQAA
jgi:hypothetical protein